jgi:hypothetical protein
MPFISHRLIILTMRRIFHLITFTSFLLIIITIASRWPSSTTVLNDMHDSQININTESSLNMHHSINVMPIHDRVIHGRPDLAKYVHLDLKGAPPKVKPFYENFFHFIEKLQMGVKGVLIEYEDMLPLQGRFANVSRKNRQITTCTRSCSLTHRLHIVLVIAKKTSNLFKMLLKNIN